VDLYKIRGGTVASRIRWVKIDPLSWMDGWMEEFRHETRVGPSGRYLSNSGYDPAQSDGTQCNESM
jgi:hypothetical protein